MLNFNKKIIYIKISFINILTNKTNKLRSCFSQLKFELLWIEI